MSALTIAPAVELVDAPPDPVSLDATRPVDLDICGVCMGDGAIQVPTGYLYAREFDAEACWSCGGTGQRGAA